MRRTLLGLLAAVLPAAAMAAAWRPAVLDVAVPGRGAERALLLRPAAPRGTLVMLPGGDGEFGIAPDGTMAHADNVVIHTAPLWLARGWAPLIPDARGNLRGSRATPGYGAATSQGAVAATNGAARAPGVSALVLLEAVSRRGSSGETTFDADPAAVTAPVLVVADAADRCPVTPPGDADRVAAAFTGSRRVAVLRVGGDGPRGASRRDCGSLSPHGYRGIESEVVDRVAAWLD